MNAIINNYLYYIMIIDYLFMIYIYIILGKLYTFINTTILNIMDIRTIEYSLRMFSFKIHMTAH